MRTDGAGDAREVGQFLDLPLPWTWEARAGGLGIGTEDNFRDTRSSWVYVHWGRSSRWVYLVQPLCEWALENGYRDLLYPQPQARWVGQRWYSEAAARLGQLVTEYVQATERIKS